MRASDLPERLLLGPGPSNVAESVLAALSRPVISHLDPEFLGLLDEVQTLLAQLFKTQSAFTLPISGTGSAGMEACFVNLLEPGDTALVAVQGVFGERMVSCVERLGARAIRVEAPMGEVIPEERLIQGLEAHKPELVALVHAETSTGVAQPVRAVAEAARDAGALVVLDCVTSLAGMDLRFDEWRIDAAYSATQKCLSCPPGLAPVAFGPRALARLERRQRPVPSWYLDLSLIGRYFGKDRVYHHTAPISMIFGLHAALERILEEGLEARFERHQQAHQALVEGLESLGFQMLVEPDHRLPMLNAVIPPIEDEASARRRLLQEHNIEVGAGLGPLAGRIWRIGLMGENARTERVQRFLKAVSEVL